MVNFTRQVKIENIFNLKCVTNKNVKIFEMSIWEKLMLTGS